MSETRSDHSWRFLAGLLVGAVAGGAAALLMTPRAGRELRGTISHELKRLALKTSAIDLHDWSEIAEEENSRNLIENLERIRAAGL